MSFAFKRSEECLSKRTLQGYVAATLSSKERFEVENHLLDCALCQAAVDGLTDVQLRGDEAQTQRDLALLKQQYPANDSRPSARLGQRVWWLLILLALLAAAAWMWRKHSRENKADRLYALYFVPATNEYPALQLRGRQEKFYAHPLLVKAMQYYDDEHYAAAIEGFKAYLAERPGDGQVAFYAGIAHMELRQLEEAIVLLEQALDNYPDHSISVHWYLALAYLLHKDNAAARSELQYLAGIESPYREKAAAILAQL